MLPTVLAVVLAVAVAWWSWRDRLDQPVARWAMLARTVALAALLLLLLDPGIAARRIEQRPLVLLDNSVSMHAAQGRAAEASRLAATLGDTISFGELSRGEPGARTDLRDALAGAAAGGRAVTVVTDGEVSDASEIPADLLALASIRVLARALRPDIGLTEIQAPLRLTAGDTLALEVSAQRTAGSPDTAGIVVRDSSTVLMRGTLRFGASNRARIRLVGALPRGMQGERWLRIERTGPADAEPDDDVRWWRLLVAPTPGVVVIADAPDWDSRALYRALKDVVDAPLRGYAQLQHGQWRRMDDLRSVSAADVMAAARSADLLAVRGDVKPWRALGRARLLWPAATLTGDWYINGGGLSPLSSAFTGAEPDSLPPAAGIIPVDSAALHGWIGATARLSRRGIPTAVIGGVEDRTGRNVTIGIDGLYRWSLRGGVAGQAWRSLIADAASWLLAAPEGDSVRARVTTPVTERGRPVLFRWVGSGGPVPLAVRLRGPRGERTDTLRFDGVGNAALALPVGRYRYALESGSGGTFAIEPYANELLPAPVTVTEHAGRGAAGAPRRSLRELLWLFGIAIAGFGTEWMLRRRLGLR